MQRSQAMVELPLCLQRMQSVFALQSVFAVGIRMQWVFAVPASAGQILQLGMALQKMLLESLQTGVEW
eukprot:2775639-Prymnesium_polylepis.1